MSTKSYNVVLFLGREEAPFFEQALQQFPLNYCLSVCKKQEFMPKLKAQEHEWRRPDVFDDVDWNAITPLDEEIIEQMRLCEVRAMQMYDRLGGKGLVPSYQERKRHYLRQLRFCNHVLTRRHIDLFLLSDVPHHGMSYILYSLCKVQRIPTLFPYHIDPITDAYLLQEDWEDPSPGLDVRFRQLLERKVDARPIQLSPSFERYWQQQTSHSHLSPAGKTTKSDKRTKPWYSTRRVETSFEHCMRIARSIRNPIHVLWNVLLFLPRRLRPSYLHERMRRLICYRRAQAVYGFYDACANRPDLQSPFIFVSLSLQPEATTLPMGGAYVDQLLMVQMLRSFLPENVLIYVKEHPQQKAFFPYGRGRSREFYEDFLACKGVRFVPLDFSSFQLIDHCIAVATVTGTPAFEALFNEKPALLFGHRYFQYANGIFMIRTKGDCQRALHAILVEGFRPSCDDVPLFLKALNEMVVEGSFGLTRKAISRFSPEENARRAGDAIALALEQRFGWKRE